MDIREISYIIAIADKQSITAAAASLFISQPALSQACGAWRPRPGASCLCARAT